MATLTTISLLDDLDSSQNADQTVEFGFEKVSYEIDLTEEHADELRDAFAPYVEAGRIITDESKKSFRTVSSIRKNTVAGREHSAKEIRVWARSKGLEVSDFGRLHQELIDEYMAENG